MPLCILLWIIVLIPAAILLWVAYARWIDMDSDVAAQGVCFLLLALVLAVPNLLWYKSVRDVMTSESWGRRYTIHAPAEVEAPAVFHPELMVQ